MKGFHLHLFKLLEKIERHPWAWSAIFSLFGTLLIVRSVADYKTRLAKDLETVQVLVTNQKIQTNAPIHPSALAVQSVVKKYLPMGVLFASDASKIEGKTVLRPMDKGEMLLWSNFDALNPSAFPAGQILKGYRALSILVDEESSVSYQTHAGDHVDLILSLAQKASGNPITITLLQDVTVLQTHEPSERAESFSSVILMVTAQEAALIRHAQTKGKISMSLRNPLDHIPSDAPPFIVDQNLYDSAFVQSLKKEREHTVEIIKNFKE